MEPNEQSSGIPVSSDVGYIATTAVGLTILHFIAVPLFAILGVVLLAMLGICEIPCIAVALATHHAHSAIPAMVALGAVGGIIWLWWSWRLCRKIWRSIGKHTRMKYVNGYEGPLPSIGRPAPTSESSPRIPRR